MTLHLVLNAPDCTVHVSDRRLTQRAAETITEFDDNANKVILAFTERARVSIGYAGLAWIEDRPMDQWLVERMIGEDFGPFKPWIETDLLGIQPLSTIVFGGQRRPPIGRMLANIRDGLRRWRRWPQNRALRSRSVSVFASGYELVPLGGDHFQVDRFNWRLRLGAYQDTPAIGPPRYYRRIPHLAIFMQSPAVLPSSEMRRLHKQALTAHATEAPCTSVNVERVLVDALRQQSVRSSLIGPDVMCIRMPSFHCTEIRRARIRPGQSAPAQVRVQQAVEVRFSPLHQTTDAEGTTAYTPWIIHEQGYIRPAKIEGGLSEFGVGQTRVRVRVIGGNRKIMRIVAQQPKSFNQPLADEQNE